MKRRDIIRRLKKSGLVLIEGANHTLVFNQHGPRMSAIPRHNEIPEGLARDIEKQTGITLRQG